MAGRPVVLPFDLAVASGGTPVTELSSDFNALRDTINDSGAGATNYAVDSGSTNNYIATLVPPALAYSPGMTVVIKPANSNTGASVININALGNVSILHADGTALTGNELISGVAVAMVYNGTAFVLANSPVATASSSGLLPAPYAQALFYDSFINIAGWLPTISGAGASFLPTATTVDATNKGFGVAAGLTGNTSTGSSFAAPSSVLSVFPGLGPMQIDVRIYLTQIGTAAQNFVCYFGLSDGLTLANSVLIGNAFNISASNWVGVCTSFGSPSTTNGVAVTAGAYHKLTIQINSNWTSVNFLADGVAVGSPIITNIPTTGMAPTLFIAKSAGTTTIGYYIDDYRLSYPYAK